jgi:hypothetical protein
MRRHRNGRIMLRDARFPLTALLLSVVLATPLAASGPAATDLIARLRRQAPARIAFVEVRFSPLLREPIVVSGELGYLGPLDLDRNVTMPYRERTAIRGDSVTVERDGEPPRSFALKRAPELRGLLSGFAGLLAGDAAAIEHDFELAARGDDDAWTLQLTPSDRPTRRRLERIVVTGAASQPRCLAVVNAPDAATVMLLGDSTDAPRAGATLADFLAYCRAE